MTALERQELVANERGDVRIVEPFLSEWVRARFGAPVGGARPSVVVVVSSSPARRITIWSSSIVTLTGRWPAQCSA